MKIFLLAVAFSFLFLLNGCDEVEKEACVFKPDVSPEEMTFQFEQFEDSLLNLPSKKALVGLFGRQPAMRDFMFRRSEYPDDSVFTNEVYQRLTNPHMDSLLTETKQVFGDLSDLRQQFQEAFANIRYYYPDFSPPRVQTVVTGLLGADLLVSDSLIIVSLDYYLGPGGRYRPKIYDYLLRRYDPEDIVPSCMLMFGIDERLNKTDLNDKTVLAEMIAYGKAFYFAKHTLPCVPDSVFIWYTDAEIDGSRANEDLIWARFIQDKVIYSTSMIEKRNYLGERPFTSQVGEKCPGRIGQWIGWRIVKQYMRANPGTTLPELMQLANAGEIFKQSKYRPKKDL